jgi:hypothetical protein
MGSSVTKQIGLFIQSKQTDSKFTSLTYIGHIGIFSSSTQKFYIDPISYYKNLDYQQIKVDTDQTSIVPDTYQYRFAYKNSTILYKISEDLKLKKFPIRNLMTEDNLKKFFTNNGLSDYWNLLNASNIRDPNKTNLQVFLDNFQSNDTDLDYLFGKTSIIQSDNTIIRLTVDGKKYTDIGNIPPMNSCGIRIIKVLLA